MGNGANSRPENPVLIQSPTRPVPTANGYSSNGYVANGGDGRFQPYNGVQSQYSVVPSFRNGPAPHHSGTYESADHFEDYDEVDQSIEHAVAPHSSTYPQSYHGRDRRDEPVHQSAFASRQYSNRAYGQSQLGNGNQPADKTGGSSYSTSDEILFEIFHCMKTGKDYSVINVDGQRYFVDSWNSGTANDIKSLEKISGEKGVGLGREGGEGML